MRVQQYTGPVHAKGVEDTAFYRYNVLVSLNEVGGDPERFGRSPAEFHAANRRRLERWPLEMIGTATHDTKRGEDVRARINVLSEMPDAWRRIVGRWLRLNGSARAKIEGEHAPDRNDEYLFYQTLIGTWPAEPVDAPVPHTAPDEYVERLQAYMRKAIKEAKAHTSWINENHAYEQALEAFVNATLRGEAAPAFLQTFVPFQRRVARFGAVNSLAQLVLKMTSPGVVDLYQGTELWDFHLVDPDNRRPVDYAARQSLLDTLPENDASEAFEAAVGKLFDEWMDGRIKMFVTTRLLHLRRTLSDLWLDGEYLPLHLSPRGDDPLSDRHLIAFARRLGTRVAVIVVPRFVSELMPSQDHWPPIGFETWKTLHVNLPAELASETTAGFTNVLTGAAVRPLVSNGSGAVLPAADLFKTLPIAVLLGGESVRNE
jgi:(1->4)-alpha-D-glucan 1-alpha-D-glucosylmutase